MNIKVLDFIEKRQCVKKYCVGKCIYAIDLGDKTKIGQTGLIYERLMTHLRNYKKEYGEPAKFRVAISCGISGIGLVEASILKHFAEHRVNNTEILTKGFDEVVAFIDNFLEIGRIDGRDRPFEKTGHKALNEIFECCENLPTIVPNLIGYDPNLHSLRKLHY